MTLFLRAIRQGRWHEQAWLTGDDTPASTLLDLEARGNILSVFEITDFCDVDRIAIAIAAGRDYPGNFDYAFFEDAALATIGIDAVDTPGATPDPVVNQVHRDLKDLTTGKIGSLATVIYKSKSTDRIQLPDVLDGILKAIRSGTWDTNHVSDKLKRRLAAKLWPSLPVF
jgi:hypothetical protein